MKYFILAPIFLATIIPAANAQDNVRQFEPPVQQVDEKGMDLVNGQARINIPLVTFGESLGGFSASIGISYPDGVGMKIYPRPESTTDYIDEFGLLTSASFPWETGYFRSHAYDYLAPDGSRYSSSLGPNHVARITPVGGSTAASTIYSSNGDKVVSLGGFDGNSELFGVIEKADGEIWQFYWDFVTVPINPRYPSQKTSIARIKFMTISRGYGIQFLYSSDVAPTSGTDPARYAWIMPVKVTPYNKTIVSCDESLKQECPAVSALTSTTISYNSGSSGSTRIMEMGSTQGIELLTNSQGQFVKRHSAVPNSSVTYTSGVSNAGTGYTSSISDASGTSNYLYGVNVDDSGYVPYMYATSQDALGGAKEVVGHTLFGQMTSLNDNGKYWQFSVSAHPGDYRVYGYSTPEGNEIGLARDTRNNITQAEQYAKPGSSLPSVTLYSANYPTGCLNPKTCNKPVWTKDAKSNQTDYTYDPAHGGVLTETGPAVNGVRPQLRYEYSQRYAWTKGSGGAFVQSSTPIWLKTREEYCRTTAAVGSGCAGGALDEVVTELDYGPNSGPNNLLLRGIAVTATNGSGSLETLRTCYAYDAFGRQVSKTEPQANLSVCP